MRETLAKILPADATVEEVVYEPESEGEVFTSELFEVKSRLENQGGIKEFTSRIFNGLDGYDRRRVLDNLADYVGEDCNLYLRLSKTEAEAGSIVLESKDSIHVKIKIAAFPAKKETAVEVAREIITASNH